MLDFEDRLVLCALSIEKERDAEWMCEFMMEQCFRKPDMILHPSVDWWARTYADVLAGYVFKSPNYKERAPARRARNDEWMKQHGYRR